MDRKEGEGEDGVVQGMGGGAADHAIVDTCAHEASLRQRFGSEECLIMPNYRTRLCQTTEQDCAKLPNRIAPNYRTAVALIRMI